MYPAAKFTKIIIVLVNLCKVSQCLYVYNKIALQTVSTNSLVLKDIAWGTVPQSGSKGNPQKTARTPKRPLFTLNLHQKLSAKTTNFKVRLQSEGGEVRRGLTVGL